MPNRNEVYGAIDSERAYQEALRAKAPNPGNHGVPAYLLFMDQYLAEAKKIAATDWTADADRNTLHVIRKVTALGVACMEAHGAPFREAVGNDELNARVGNITG